MDPTFDSIDSNAPAPLVFEAEQDSETPTDSLTDTDSDSVNNQTNVKRTEQKLSLSQYESVRTGEETPTNTSAEHKEMGQSGGAEVHVNAEVTIKDVSTVPETSTPVRSVTMTARTDSVNCSPVHLTGTPTRGGVRSSFKEPSSLTHRESKVTFLDPREITVPVVGYETMEQRSRFTVFKLHVQKAKTDNWFVFRRYSDFTQLQRKLRILFPMFRFNLPPKRWFRDNFDRDFLDDRVQGLQAFIHSITFHRDVCNSIPVQQFFCFEDPPGAHDSIEESRAYCSELEDKVYELKKELRDKDSELELLKDELNLYKSQVEMLTKALRDRKSNGATNSTIGVNTVPSPSNSLAECDILSRQVENSLSVSIDTSSQVHSTVDLQSVPSGVSLKDEILAATHLDT